MYITGEDRASGPRLCLCVDSACVFVLICSVPALQGCKTTSPAASTHLTDYN